MAKHENNDECLTCVSSVDDGSVQREQDRVQARTHRERALKETAATTTTAAAILFSLSLLPLSLSFLLSLSRREAVVADLLAIYVG